MISAEVLCQGLEKAFDADRRASGGMKFKPSGNHASAIGHPCLRFLCYRRLNWKESPDPSLDLAYIFREGREVHEADVIREISRLGFQWEGTQEVFDAAELAGWEKTNITGKIDGRLVATPEIASRVLGISTEETRAKMPKPVYFAADIKGISGNTWPQIFTAEDLDRFSWMRSWSAQLRIYVALSRQRYPIEETAILILKSKQTGRLRFVPIPPDPAALEELRQKAEKVERAVRRKKHSARMRYTPDVCDRCDFETLCEPKQHFGKGLEFKDDPEMIALIEEKHRTAEARKRYEAAHDEISATFKPMGEGTAIVGDYLVMVRKHGKGLRVITKALGIGEAKANGADD